MKKLLLFAAGAALLGLAACNSGHGSSNAEGFDSLFTQKQTDSLIVAMAQAQGMQNNTKFEQTLQQMPNLSRKDFLRGLKYILDADTATSFSYGMYTAFNIVGQFNNWENTLGLKVNRTAFYNNFSKAFMADSVNEVQSQTVQGEAQMLFNKLREAQQAYERAKLENSPEAIANVQRGREYVDSVLKADPEVKATASGVAVKVENPGEGEAITPKDRIVMTYHARTLDGREFDKQEGENIRPVLVSTRPAGLQEGLSKIGKGGKATIYIPGKEAFGVENNRRFDLGPNETVIYDVEVVDVNPQAKK